VRLGRLTRQTSGLPRAPGCPGSAPAKSPCALPWPARTQCSPPPPRRRGASAHVRRRRRGGRANLGRVAMTWMQRLRRLFGIDIGHCPRCGASLRLVAVITSPRASSTSSSSTSTPDTPAPPAGARDGPRGDRAQPERGRSRRKDMRIDTMTKVAIYARYSSDNQGEASIED